jgi:cytochrome c-type biogenesis protein CcmH/NrfG
MAFFYRHNPKKFNYIPRYYDPEKEAWEQKKAELGYDAKLSHEAQFRAQMRRSWSAPKNEESKEEQRAKLIRRIVLGVFVCLVFYLVFGTGLMEKIVYYLRG